MNGLSSQSSRPPSIERSGNSEDFKGPLGLNLLHSPPEPIVDFIFVHGLGGGSRKTWSKTTDPSHYWPKEWLAKDDGFQTSRIYSFGYAADWNDKKESVLAILDFARALLAEIMNDREMSRANVRIGR